ncbi:MAG TPA: SRPBCC family protein [Ohtaekwangia sp.]|uniref:SRPBCC family protein n=1 Tax=Ohtaekwangia sp. TaxID=2066019 RepID=UPI002F95AF2C
MTSKNQIKIVAEQGKQELYIYREFDAPREAVYRAFVEPELVVQWLGPLNMKMKIEKYDIRTGGSYRYIHTDGQGNEYAFNGVVHEATAPERVIQTFEFEGLPERGHVSLDTALFEPLPNNRTRLVMHSVFRSLMARDGMVMSGMEQGLGEGFARLDELLAVQVQ